MTYTNIIIAVDKMLIKKSKYAGFTLLEMLLVLVIATSILIMIITYTSTRTDESKRDFTVNQIEQILNAGLAYYINNSSWPADIGQLKTGKYLPNKTTINNAWGQPYVFYNDATTGTFSICTQITGRSLGGGTFASTLESGIVANRLPMGYVTTSCPASGSPLDPATCNAATCAVVTTVNIPGQNLNNARSFNFAGLYHNGACVPAPTCPTPSMEPSIMVVPVAVSGNYAGGPTVYPISSFMARAVGDASGNPTAVSPGPQMCSDKTKSSPCDGGTSPLPAGLYWRVCLQIVTERGTIGEAGSTWQPESGIVMAITRCVPANEPAGSPFSVFESF